MTSERVIATRFERERKQREGSAADKREDATPQQNLVRAAETGQFEAIVAKAQPAEPPKMVTPEEREAERARADKAATKPKARRKAEKKPEPKAPKPPPTPQQQFIDENCKWTQRGPDDYRERVPYGRCLTEYDPLTGAIIGDGSLHDEEDDQW